MVATFLALTYILCSITSLIDNILVKLFGPGCLSKNQELQSFSHFLFD